MRQDICYARTSFRILTFAYLATVLLKLTLKQTVIDVEILKIKNTLRFIYKILKGFFLKNIIIAYINLQEPQTKEKKNVLNFSKIFLRSI